MTASTSQLTDFSRDVLGRYVCNGLDEALHSADRGATRPDGSSQADAKPFDVIVIGGGSFGPTFAEHVFAADKTHSHRVLVLEGGPLSLPEHVQNMPMIGLSPEATADWYAQADILVIPSWYEPFGMVVLEGMLEAIAIAASDVGRPGEILEHEQTALLFAPRDPASLASTIARLATNPGLRQRLGTNAAQDVRRNWLWPSAAAKMQHIYTHATTTACEVPA